MKISFRRKLLWNRLKNIFVPGRQNNYRALVLQPALLAAFVFIFLLNQTLISFFALLRPGVLGYSSDITPERVIELTNNERQKQGLKPLKNNSLLNEAALRKAGDMFAFDYWAHKSPSGREPWSFLKEVNYNYRVAGENLARDFSDAEGVTNAWMKSPSHRENIVNPKFNEIGIAVVDGTLEGIQTTLVVQFFGARSGVVAAVETPEAAEVQAAANQEVLEEEQVIQIAQSQVLPEESKPVISPLSLTKIITVFLLGIIVIALAIDNYFILKKKIYRSVGRTTAHAGFLVLIFLLILLNGSQGLIN